ncbi:nucleoside 2-deoxyribosyltransferase [Paraburkholderia nemoris]|uniref:nucleoside 2-deoxyribosyltransferase n=1 Tax=Paraburkholderia nemoris TaxID=2793076 RepID=UPI0038BE09D4
MGTNVGDRKRIYLAGFDVFRVDAVEYGRSLQRLCASFGFEGIFPLDSVAPLGLSPVEKAGWIFRTNLAEIRRADVVMANIADFRGTGEPDCGTAFETGFAAALGKDVWGYRDHLTPLLHRVPSTGTVTGPVCERGYLVEDFELPVNLMVACAVRIVQGGPKECLQAMVCAYGIGSIPSPYSQDGESEIRLAEG